MDSIERSIQVVWRHRVLFTDHVFDPQNPTLADILTYPDPTGPSKTLVVMDEALSGAQAGLVAKVSSYFSAFGSKLRLVCPPLIVPGGEQAKNSWANVSEIHK